MATTGRKKIGLIIGGVFALVAGVIIWNFMYYGIGFEFRLFKTSELVAMEKAASTIQLTTGREVKRRQNDFHNSLGMPVYAEITVDYTPTTNYSKQDLLAEISQDLQKNNFKEDRLEMKEPGYYHAVLPQERFEVVVSVIDITEGNVVKVNFTTQIPNSPQTPTPKLDIRYNNIKTN
jgi:hypothetical protein